MDYTPLVKAVQDGDQVTANKLVSEATPILVRMLMARMNASRQDAEDAVQAMFVYIIEAIREGRIHNPSGLLAYMIKTCRHNYLKSRREYTVDYEEGMAAEPATEAVQLERLIESERMDLYRECVDNLKEDYREFFDFWISHPDTPATDVAREFEISVNNAWTRKHRVIKWLQECIQRKLGTRINSK
ncbi:MAG: sigma-70 family RNA polymerase sigma factor [Balneolaceae bacterium]